MKPNTRLKINKFFKKYGKIIALIALAWLAIIMIDKFLEFSKKDLEPTTTYEPHTSIMDQTSYTPKKIKDSMEEFVEKYVEYCNNAEYEDAYNMLSDDCKENNFASFTEYKSYVSNRFGSKKIYSIQNYSNYDDKYIYTVKLYDDILATGLTNSTYRYQEEKITATYDDNKIVFSVGNFIEKKDIKSVQENNYLKVDVRNKIVKYDFEIYEIRFTNRSDKTIIIENGKIENEILLKTGDEYRNQIDATDIIIEPNESTTRKIIFGKLYDDGKDSNSIILNSIRVVDNYIEDDSNESNAIEKFSMELGL